MARELGPRTTVLVGKNKKSQNIYSFMLKKTAEYFDFPGVQTKLPVRVGKKSKRATAIRGAVGQGHIKIPTGKKTQKGAVQYAQVPMPAGMTIPKIETFLKTAKRNKPEFFVTQDGTTYPVGKK